MKKTRYIIGIDEVGRGPLAGPVTVCALALSHNFQLSAFNFKKKSKIPLRDSKKLRPRQREGWAKFIKQNKIPYAICSISPVVIDKINISSAANLAAKRALLKLITNNQQLTTNGIKIYLDGGLKIKSNLNQKTIIKGDEKIPAISLASIMAKVHRDRLMEKIGKKYSRYGFNKHKGYGTKLHYEKIKKYGASKIHRRSFLK